MCRASRWLFRRGGDAGCGLGGGRAAAQDMRFAMAVSNGSGCGGARLGRARDLYRAYGVEERMGYHCHEGPHRLMPVDWERFMDFADRHLKTPASVRGAACNKIK